MNPSPIDLKSTLNGQPEYTQIDYSQGQPPKKSCRQHYCGWKAVIVYVVLAFVFVVIGISIAGVGIYVLGKGDVCDVPIVTCKGSPPSEVGHYNAKKDIIGGFTYLYTANFVINHAVTFNDTQIDLGTMNLCVQTTGKQLVGP